MAGLQDNGNSGPQDMTTNGLQDNGNSGPQDMTTNGLQDNGNSGPQDMAYRTMVIVVHRTMTACWL